MMKKLLLIFLVVLLKSCSERDVVNSHKINKLMLYEINCEEQIYFSLEKGNCSKLPKSYFYLKPDTDNYYIFFIKEVNNKLIIYSLYNDVVKIGNISKEVEIHEYKDYKDNIFLNDSLIGKVKSIDGYIR